MAANGNPWCRLYSTLPDNPKVARLAKVLKRPKATVIGYITTLWCRVTAERPSGVMRGWTDGEVEVKAGWTGGAGKFIAGALEAGWLEGPEGARVIHNRQRYVGSYRRAKRQEKYRERKAAASSSVTSQEATGEKPVTSQGCNSIDPVMARGEEKGEEISLYDAQVDEPGGEPTVTPPPEREMLNTIEGYNLEKLQEVGFKRFGHLGGAYIRDLAPLCPITEHEWQTLYKSPGKSWGYVVKVLPDMRGAPKERQERTQIRHERPVNQPTRSDMERAKVLARERRQRDSESNLMRIGAIMQSLGIESASHDT